VRRSLLTCAFQKIIITSLTIDFDTAEVIYAIADLLHDLFPLGTTSYPCATRSCVAFAIGRKQRIENSTRRAETSSTLVATVNCRFRTRKYQNPPENLPYRPHALPVTGRVAEMYRRAAFQKTDSTRLRAPLLAPLLTAWGAVRIRA
jgi:hypothetical protein